MASDVETNEGGNVVPGFLTKLWKLVDDEDTDELITWSEEGLSFHVLQPNLLAKELLPYYFKHSNLSSFIRQLNMYGFKKLATVDGGGLMGDRDAMVFQHPFFVRGNQHLLPLIKRKTPVRKDVGNASVETSRPKPEVDVILQEVNQMKVKQAQLNMKLLSMKRENEGLWQEVADLRAKHNNQQTIVQRLIQFLITMARGQRGFDHKRKLPLAINFSEEARQTKVPRFSRQMSRSDAASSMDLLEGMAFSQPEMSSGNARITEVTNDVTSSERVRTLSDGEGPSYTVTSPSNDSPNFPPTPDLSAVLDPDDIITSPSPAPAPDLHAGLQTPVVQLDQLPLATTSPRPATSLTSTSSENGIKTDQTALKRSVSSDVDTLQIELDALKDMLATGQFTIDASTLSGLFAPDVNLLTQEDTMLRNMNTKLETSLGSIKNNSTGQELVRYTEPGGYPDLLALVDDGENGMEENITSDLYSGNDDVIDELLKEPDVNVMT